ncbi:hypothetical protein [Sphingobacterium sp.]|uniref:hypothetical protein n=1 Tax=Sphingobacterium sp. TaxID=341027 RepID=UPI0028B1BD8F|nr:hypothetical protein [Sphingobacterium sp.]
MDQEHETNQDGKDERMDQDHRPDRDDGEGRMGPGPEGTHLMRHGPALSSHHAGVGQRRRQSWPCPDLGPSSHPLNPGSKILPSGG